MSAEAKRELREATRQRLEADKAAEAEREAEAAKVRAAEAEGQEERRRQKEQKQERVTKQRQQKNEKDYVRQMAKAVRASITKDDDTSSGGEEAM